MRIFQLAWCVCGYSGHSIRYAWFLQFCNSAIGDTRKCCDFWNTSLDHRRHSPFYALRNQINLNSNWYLFVFLSEAYRCGIFAKIKFRFSVDFYIGIGNVKRLAHDCSSSYFLPPMRKKGQILIFGTNYAINLNRCRLDSDAPCEHEPISFACTTLTLCVHSIGDWAGISVFNSKILIQDCSMIRNCAKNILIPGQHFLWTLRCVRKHDNISPDDVKVPGWLRHRNTLMCAASQLPFYIYIEAYKNVYT